MDRHSIMTLAAIYGSPTAREYGENVMLRCPYTDDPIAHPPSRGSPTLSVKVVPAGVSLTHCFRCEVAGTLESVFTRAINDGMTGLGEALKYIQDIDKADFSAALTAARYASITAEEKSAYVPPYQELERYALACHRIGVHDYLLNERGFTKHDIERWEIGHDTNEGVNRATFPVRNERGQVVGICRRAVDEETRPKWHDQPRGEWKNMVFMGEHRIDPTLERVVFVEGPTDVVYASRYIPNVLGLLGASTRMTTVRLEKIRRWAKSVVFILDGDDAGRSAFYGRRDPRGRWHPGYYEILRPYMPVLVGHLPPGKDPASAETSELVAAYEKASMPMFDKRTMPSYYSQSRGKRPRRNRPSVSSKAAQRSDRQSFHEFMKERRR